jgi:type IV secretory pathway VirJ component
VNGAPRPTLPARRPAIGLLLVLLLCSSPAPVARAAGRSASPDVTVKTSRGDFKLIVYPPAASAADPERPLVLLASGEGGWRRFDVMIAGFLSDAGYWVGGMDAMKYFWEAQDDRQALAVDIRAYADALATIAGRKPGGPILLAGFSFGADLAPWVAGAGGWGDRLRGMILIGPDETGSLEFRIMEIMGFSPKDHVFSVAEALRSAAGVPVLFLHGEKDSNSAAPALATSAGEPKRIAVIPGADHHYSGKEEDLRRALLEGLDWIRSQVRPASQDVQKAP